jgi:hypothetical protein
MKEKEGRSEELAFPLGAWNKQVWNRAAMKSDFCFMEVDPLLGCGGSRISNRQVGGSRKAEMIRR